MPVGLKPVKRTLATGEVRLYWYHRATGKRLKHAPETAEGLLEVAALDKRAGALEAAAGASLSALWDTYRKGQAWRALKPRTRSDYQAVFDWIGDAADKVMVKEIVIADIIKLQDKAYQQKGRRFGNYVVQVLRMLLEWGRLRGWRPDNPGMGIKAIRRPTGAKQVNRAWSMVELRAFASTAPFQLLVPFAMGLLAGMRQGDALIATLSAYDGSALRWIAGKNGEACMAPVDAAFKVILDEAVRRAREAGAVQLCLTSNGTAWTQSGFRASFFKHLRDLRTKGAVQPGCTFHGLRHTLASAARNEGSSNYQIASAIGDRTTAMADIYGRDANRSAAQTTLLEANQKRLGNIEWKTDWKTLP